MVLRTPAMTRAVALCWALGLGSLGACGDGTGSPGTDSGLAPRADSGTGPGPTVKQRLGFPCTDGVQCSSDFCVDGVCCDGPCTASCQACVAAFTGEVEGICANVVANADPNDSCPPSGCSDNDDCSTPGEICDNAMCIVGKQVFVSSTDIGITELNGLQGADAVCQQDAQTAGLTGTYKAWLSTSVATAADRLTQATVPYVLTNKTVIASNWADLVDGTLQHPIDHYADGTKVGAGGSRPVITGVWTGTGTSGTQAGPSCLDWTSNHRLEAGTIGRTYDTDSGWTDFNRDASCENVFNRRLYCFEQ